MAMNVKNSGAYYESNNHFRTHSPQPLNYGTGSTYFPGLAGKERPWLTMYGSFSETGEAAILVMHCALARWLRV